MNGAFTQREKWLDVEDDETILGYKTVPLFWLIITYIKYILDATWRHILENKLREFHHMTYHNIKLRFLSIRDILVL